MSRPMMASDSTSLQVLGTLRQIIRAIDLHSRHLSKSFGLTGPQLVIVRELHREGALTIGELARRVSLSQATVTTIIDRLEGRSIVTRTRDVTDKRRVYVSATERAAELLEAHPNPLQDSFSRRFEALAPWEQTLILSSIQRVADMMNAGDLPPDEFEV